MPALLPRVALVVGLAVKTLVALSPLTRPVTLVVKAGLASP